MLQPPDLPLFAWKPPVRIIAFPLDKRVGRIRDVASKMLGKTTDRHTEHYQAQVTEALMRHLERIGIPDREADEQIIAFWHAVEAEMVRLSYRGRTGGDAA